MPGIITHSKVFDETIKLLSKEKAQGHLKSSILALFSEETQFKSALFGTIGPNIFDYIPTRKHKSPCGHIVSFLLHDGKSGDMLKTMIASLQSYGDNQTEWTAIQRAYLYGLVSHIIADAVFHPFIYYWSGFSQGGDKSQKQYFREQNLLFTYNIDNHFLHHSEDSDTWCFELEEMLPQHGKDRFNNLEPALKEFILSSILEALPDFSESIVWKRDKADRDNLIKTKGALDYSLFMIRQIHSLKRGKEGRLQRIYRYIHKKKYLNNDFITPYPGRRRYNESVLNFHRERWEFPVGCSKGRYDSIEKLLQLSAEKSLELWLLLESVIMHGKNGKNLKKHEIFSLNAYTGCQEHSFKDMKIQDPVKLLV